MTSKIVCLMVVAAISLFLSLELSLCTGIYFFVIVFADVKVLDTWQPYQATLNLEKQASSLC